MLLFEAKSLKYKPMQDSTPKIPFLSENLLSSLEISTKDIIASIEDSIIGKQQGRVWSAPKAVITVPDQRYMMAALAAMDEPSLLAVKTVVLNPSNPDIGLPQINGLVTMLDSQTGLPMAILDGNWVTAVRTAGLSAVAAKYMANKNSQTLGFVGCGLQARSHLQAFSEMFPLRRIKLFGRGQSNINKLCEAAKQLGLSYEICDSGQAAMHKTDLIVTTVTHTGGAAPFLDASGLAKGTFVTAVDLGAPWHKDSFATLDRIIIDDLLQEQALPNKLCDPALITSDLSALVLGNTKGRESAEERNAFIFRGHALGDLAVSALAYQRYCETKVELIDPFLEI